MFLCIVGMKGTAGQATGDLLVVGDKMSCSLVIITDSQNDETLVLLQVRELKQAYALLGEIKKMQ